METPMTLFERLKDNDIRTLSVIGLAKNVGKTTTMNYIIREASGRREIRLGITSSGWDGEAYDTITGEPKPRIIVPPGTLVATTEDCLRRTTAPFERVKETGMMTSLGDVVLIRAVEAGGVEVAGPTTISELCRVRDMMLEAGCTLVIFDGALNRKASASPEVSQAMILATGMNAGYHLDDVKKKTAFHIEIFSQQGWNPKVFPLPHPPSTAQALLLDGSGAIIEAIELEALRSGKDCPSLKKGGTLVFSGSITDTILETLMRSHCTIDIVAHDGTKFFLSPEMHRRWKKRGGRIFLRLPANIVGVTVNPRTSSGRHYEASDFLLSMAEICAPYEVWDIVLGKGLRYPYERETGARQR
jgi:hypothetical protein